MRSEGTVVLVLTRADTAQDKGRRVWAHVAGTAINHGGRSPHLLAPRIERQSAVIRRALTDAGLSSGRVGWVQAHGTGTRAGDRVEATALAHALERGRPIPIGSVKGNLGHLEGGSGALGVMVAALTVHHGRIPPTLHHRTLRPSLEGLVRVPTRIEDWPHHDEGEVRVAGVSSWGFGGANAHAVLSSAPALDPPLSQDPMPLPETVVVSGHTPAALAHAAGRLAEHSPAGGSVGTVADAALARGGHLRYRSAVVASDLGALVQGLRSIQDRAPNPDVVGPHVSPATRPKLVFVYSGHGGHHGHAGTDLMRLPVFAKGMEHARSALSTHTGYAVWGPGQDVTSFQDAQHCTFLIQVALTRLLAARGVIPDLVLGHSVGEAAAARAAGALSLDETALVVARRSALLSGLSARGSLLAVRAGVEETTALLVPFASYSAPQVQVVAGSHEDLERLHRVLIEQGLWCKSLRDVIPAHSPAVAPLRCALEEALEGLAPVTPRVPMISTAHPDRMPSDLGPWGARYWAEQARSPVRFTDAIRAAARSDNGDGVVFVEVGPRALLSEHITHTLDGDGTHHTVAATADPSAFARAIGELYTLGVTLTGPIDRAHPSVVVAPGWDHTSTIMSEGCEEERRSVPSPEEVPEYLASEVARLVHAAGGIDLGASWTGLGLDSHQLLQLTSRLRRTPAWREVDVQLFLPDRPLGHVAADLADLVRHLQTISERAPTVLP